MELDPSMLAMMSPEELAALWDMPAMDPPPGQIPNLVNPGAHGSVAVGVTTLCAVIVGLAAVLRISSKVIVKKVFLEDALFVAGTGLYAGFLYEIFKLDSKVYHVHTWNVSLRTMGDLLYGTHIISLLYGLTIMLVKTAILLSWVRLFVPLRQRNTFYWISQALIWSNVLFYGVGTLTEIFQCTPRAKIWNPILIAEGEAGGRCPINITIHAKVSGFINLVSDIMILLLPQGVIWKLNITRKQKIGISLLFVVGIFATAAATVRIYYLFQTYDANDFVYYGSDVVLWMAAEIAAGILVMGFPSLPKVFKSMPGSESLISFFRSRPSRSGQSGDVESSSRKGLPSWYKPPPRQARPDPMAISVGVDNMDYDLEFLTAPSMEEKACAGQSDTSSGKVTSSRMEVV